MMLSSLRNIGARFRTDERGNLALITAVVALPLLVATTIVVDYQTALDKRTDLEAALDAAALATASHQNLTNRERADFATEAFWLNLVSDDDTIKFDVLDSSAERVKLMAFQNIPSTLGKFVSLDTLNVRETAVASRTEGEVICILALDPDGERTFEVTGGARLSAPTCAVQINSSNNNGAVVDHGGTAMAKDFCAAGGAAGSFSPHINTECRNVADPYQDRYAPMSDTGTYIIQDGPLFFDFGTRARAEDVTFVFKGENAYLDVHEGSAVYVKAPKSGPLAGMAFFQDARSTASTKRKLPVAETIIRSGGNVSIVGTAYFPTQKISFRSGSLMASQAPATSFIGYQVSIGDGANIGVAVDHRAADLPPILPRADESVRLVE